MASLFGQSAQPQTATSSVFGGGLNQNPASTNTATGGSSLFGGTGANNPTQRPTLSLFGTNNATTSQTNTANASQTTGSSLFGGNTTAQPGASSLFGNNIKSNPQPSPLFGPMNPNSQQATNSLFGNNDNKSNQPGSSSLFGAPATNTQQNSSSLFGGNTATNQPNSSSLFGGNTNNQQQVPNLFQNSAAAANPPLVSDPTFSNAASLMQAGLGTSHFGALGQASQMSLAKSRLAQMNIDTRTNEKTIPERIQSLIRKWDPNSQETLLQDYTYNAVNAAYAPFYHKNDDETEKEWEAALARKPANIETKDGETVSFIPVLVRGFHALGQRAEVQARTVNEMRARLHEMNNSLTAVMIKHQQTITVQLETARRRHVVLSQRCLRLAVKIQVLRNHGYALDRAEEELRKTLQGLESQIFDPVLPAREEEIWARLVALRERIRWLQEEGQRLGVQATEENRKELPEGVVNKTKKILRDYDGQLTHLSAELKEVKKEFAEWEQALNALKR